MWGRVTNVSENKQESGYQRASFTAQPLNGAIPKAAPLSAENWARGDLRAAFKAPPAAPKLSLADLPQRPANVPDKNDNDAATRQARDSKNETTATTPLNTTATTPQNDARAEETKVAALTPSALKPAPGIIPPQFAPVMLAGALSAKLQEKARIADGPDDYKQGDEFNTNKLSGFQKRRYLERVEESMDGDKNTARQNEQRMLLAYAAEQQRQEFMRSVEYSAALNTVNNSIRELEGERTQAYARKAELQQQIAVLDSNIQTASAEVGVMEAAKEDLEELKENKKEYDSQVAREKEMQATADEITQKAFVDQENTMKVVGKDAYISVNEAGNKTLYKIDEKGQKTKVDNAPYFDPIHDRVYLKRNQDGTTEFVNHFNAPVDDEQKAAIERALQATGAKPEDIISNHFGETARAEKILNAVSNEDVDEQIEKTNKSLSKLEEQAQKIGFPVEDLPVLDKRIETLTQSIADRKKQIAEWQGEKAKTAEELQAAEADIAHIEKQLAESAKFKQDLENGKFKNKAEMEEAMPTFLKLRYEEELEQQQAQNNQTPATTATLDNTSRANGSAAAAYDGAPKTSAISNDFKAAATNAPAAPTAEPAPAAPAPSDNMEFIAARQQLKAQALGLN